MKLIEKKCVPCEGGMPALTRELAEGLLKEVPEWSLSEDGKRISRTFTFGDFAHTMAFANNVANIADAEGHHPDLHISWGKITVDLTTHAIKGLSENDFILAAKIDALTNPSVNPSAKP